VWLIDPRRQLTRVLSQAYVHRFASTPEAIAQRMGELAEVLNIDLTGVRCGHGFDDFREAGAIEPCRFAASKARKAL